MASNGTGPRDPDLERSEYLARTSSEILACRGYGHDFPKLVPGRVLNGVRLEPVHGGGSQVTSVCPTCETTRTWIMAPGFKIDDTRSAFYEYEWPEGYASPPGSGVTRWDCRREVMRRLAEESRVAEERSAARKRVKVRTSQLS